MQDAPFEKAQVVAIYRKLAPSFDLDFPDNSFDVLINNYMFDLLPQEAFPAVFGEVKWLLIRNERSSLTLYLLQGLHCLQHAGHWILNQRWMNLRLPRRIGKVPAWGRD